MPITLHCITCSSAYKVKPSKKGRSKYCSRACHAKNTIAIKNTVTKNCLECGQPFSNMASKIKDRSYCSVRCAKVHWGRSYNKSGKDHSRYTNGAGIYRRVAFEAHGGHCNRCLSTKKLEVHHVDGNRKNNEPENLEVLCMACHHREHSLHALPLCAVCQREVGRPHNKYCSRACYFTARRKK